MDLVTGRLALVRRALPKSAEDIAYETMRKYFPFVKECFGGESEKHLKIYRISVADLPEDFSSPEADIERGKMLIPP